MIIGGVMAPVTVHVSWNCDPAVKSPLDVILVETGAAASKGVCVIVLRGLSLNVSHM